MNALELQRLRESGHQIEPDFKTLSGIIECLKNQGYDIQWGYCSPGVWAILASDFDGMDASDETGGFHGAPALRANNVPIVCDTLALDGAIVFQPAQIRIENLRYVSL
jgi:hypothetical protein